MRRPAGLVSGPSARVGVVQPQPRNLVRASLGLGTGCDCSGARSRRSAQPGDRVRTRGRREFVNITSVLRGSGDCTRSSRGSGGGDLDPGARRNQRHPRSRTTAWPTSR